ncbi:P2Y purinoceptor 1-like [Xiphophorus couchianus]|uniref:P2Y purinoceptor 1-like n=1 Tax=Xiphophorus couchianus TaxID=32473 RepID=UPI001016FBFA|nr:P2Y purinoceptor 1-like [Xiphophorus couchianus]XP_027866001.1 P2Y purinoceptor 1-like [Xiphophorus couchianus]
MNKTSCPQPDKELFEHKILPTLHILVFIVGLIANGWGLNSLRNNWRKLGNINIFVLNLGLADILYLLTLPFLIVYHLKGNKWIFGEEFCLVTRFCFNLNLYCSIGFLTCISVYRYLSIVHPMRTMGRLTTTHSVVISAVVLILVCAQSSPDMFYPKTFGKKKCFDSTSNQHMKSYLKYSIIWTSFGFCIPFLITIWSYGHVTLVVCRSNTIDKDLKRRSFKLLVILILLFLLCYAPYHVFKNLSMYSRVLINKKICPKWDSGVFIMRQASRGLVSLNSALNPLVYLHVYEDMGAHLKQQLQGGQQMFSRLFKSNSCSAPVAQSDPDDL